MDFNYVSSCWFYNDLLYVYSDVFRLCLSHFGPNNLKLLLVVNDNSSKVSTVNALTRLLLGTLL